MLRLWTLIAKHRRPPVPPNLNPRDLSGRRERGKDQKKVALRFRKKGEAGPISIGNRGAADK